MEGNNHRNSIEYLISTRTARRILKYAREDQSNRIPVRDDTVKDNIERVLRSQKAMNAIAHGSHSIGIELAAFKRRWNALSPLYPMQSKALMEHHSSGMNLNAGGRAVKIKLSLDGGDDPHWKAVRWFESLTTDQQKHIIKEVYDRQPFDIPNDL